MMPFHLVLLVLSVLEQPAAVDGRALAMPVAPDYVHPNARLHAHSAAVHHDPHHVNHSGSVNLTSQARMADVPAEDVICQPVGDCEPCPEDLMSEPFCQPFGNRRLVRCVPNTPLPAPTDDSQLGQDDDTRGPQPPTHPPSRPPAAPLPAWESCGRLVPKERTDFYEFVLTNTIFAALALAVVLLRSERMRVVRARRLAARIGVGLRRASSGNWAGLRTIGVGGGGDGGSGAGTAEGERLMGDGGFG